MKWNEFLKYLLCVCVCCYFKIILVIKIKVAFVTWILLSGRARGNLVGYWSWKLNLDWCVCAHTYTSKWEISLDGYGLKVNLLTNKTLTSLHIGVFACLKQKFCNMNVSNPFLRVTDWHRLPLLARPPKNSSRTNNLCCTYLFSLSFCPNIDAASSWKATRKFLCGCSIY